MRLPTPLFFFAFAGMLACDNSGFKGSEELKYLGLLHANSCVEGASFLAYNSKQYALGSKSSLELNSLVDQIAKRSDIGVEPVLNSGCEIVFKMSFEGEFEKESSLTGYGNDEVREVVQVYQFKLI